MRPGYCSTSGYVPGPEVAEELRNGLTLTDQRLAMFAALSLLRQGHAISPETIDGIAACDETRNMFQQLLGELKYGYLFPPQYATPEALARSTLVSWLTHPNSGNALPTRSN